MLIQDPDSAAVHMLLGEVLDAANQTEEATAEFEAAVKAAPGQAEAHFGLGFLYWKQKRYAEARREFEAELATQPEHTQALAYLGDAEMHGGSAEKAEGYFRRALELDQGVRLAHLDLSILLARKKDVAGAERHLREAIRLEPTNPDAHYRLGRLLRSAGRVEEAEAAFAKVKELAGKEQKAPPLTELPGRGGGPAR